MIAIHKHFWSVLLVAAAVSAIAGDAAAQCATCGVPAYQTYSPVTYTAYQPVSSWYPGCCFSRWWGGGYTTAYAPSYATYYRPAYYASYAPTYSTYYRPVYYAGYASTDYAPACSTCSTTSCCDPCSSCSTCSVGVSQAVYQDSGCSTCGVVQSSTTSGTTSTFGSETRPELAPGENPSEERTVEKPSDSTEVQPEPQAEEFDDNASHFEAPQLFSPTDQTAEKSAAPVRTAEYRKPVAGERPAVRTISVSREQMLKDAVGWTGVSQ